MASPALLHIASEPELDLSLVVEEAPEEGSEFPLDQELASDPVENGARLYLHDIGRYRLLSAEQERMLARRLERGRFLEAREKELEQRRGRPASVVDLALAVWDDIAGTLGLVEALWREDTEPGLAGKPVPHSHITEHAADLMPRLRSLTGESEDVSWERLVRLEVGVKLFPERLLAVLRAGAGAVEVEEMAPALAAHLNCIRETAGESRRRMTESNLRLVVSVARRYLGRGVPFSDLVQEGNMGLMLAVERFDHRRGFRFSTYATWWIRQSVSRAVSGQGRSVRLPVHLEGMVGRVHGATGRLMQELGRNPTPAEIALSLGLLEGAAEEKLDLLARAVLPRPAPKGEAARQRILRSGLLVQRNRLPEPLRRKVETVSAKIEHLRQVSQDVLSLESPFDEGAEVTLSEYIEDRQQADPADAAARQILHGQVQKVLMTLNPRERRVLELRYGLGGEIPCTLEEAGRVLGLTRERVRQIEVEALARLRRAESVRGLQPWLAALDS